MAEGEVLAPNSLGGEKRSPWGNCGNCHLGSFTKDCASSRLVETVALVSFWGELNHGKAPVTGIFRLQGPH